MAGFGFKMIIHVLIGAPFSFVSSFISDLKLQADDTLLIGISQ